MSIPEHDPDCWCVVCGTDRLHADAHREQNARYEERRGRMYMVTTSAIEAVRDSGCDITTTVHVFGTEKEACDYATERATKYQETLYVHHVSRVMQTRTGKKSPIKLAREVVAHGDDVMKIGKTLNGDEQIAYDLARALIETHDRMTAKTASSGVFTTVTVTPGDLEP